MTTAYYWPISDLTAELETAGFEVSEAHTRTGRGIALMVLSSPIGRRRCAETVADCEISGRGPPR